MARSDPTFEDFERGLIERVGPTTGRVLEIGPKSTNPMLKLPIFENADPIGIDVEPRNVDFPIRQMNANDMEFDDDEFEAVICLSVFEHDPYWWRTMAEIKRVTKPGGTIALTVPGYTKDRERRPLFKVLGIDALADRVAAVIDRDDQYESSVHPVDSGDDEDGGEPPPGPRHRLYRLLSAAYLGVKRKDRRPVARTYGVHASPDDYYRFSATAIERVAMDGLDDLDVFAYGDPPFIAALGRKPERPE